MSTVNLSPFLGSEAIGIKGRSPGVTIRGNRVFSLERILKITYMLLQVSYKESVNRLYGEIHKSSTKRVVLRYRLRKEFCLLSVYNRKKRSLRDFTIEIIYYRRVKCIQSDFIAV